jgi:hypothetical protein
MRLRWTEEAAADLENIADYLFEHAGTRFTNYPEDLQGPEALLTFPAFRPAWQNGRHARAYRFTLFDRL